MTKWVITVDLINDGEDSAIGWGNYKGDPKDLEVGFKLFDDDGELYFMGRMTTNGDEDIFDPLDWTMDDYGCTELQIFDKSSNRWITV